MISCRGICEVKQLGSSGKFFSTISKNTKRCSICRKAFVDLIANRCPCCNQLLRTKSRRPNKKTKSNKVVFRY